MSYWIPPISGKVISCVTVQRLPFLEQQKDSIKQRMQEFDTIIANRLDAQNIDNSSQMRQQPQWNRLSLDDEDVDFIEEFTRVINDQSIPHVDDNTMNGEP